ncbi:MULTISPECIES: hypothetical protein [Pseudomonadota]|uniref:Uncharacterized protein n=1 Tax=Roseateles puraquae TaxID=431059 RepID=A0A254MYV7_9BURK|nr:MULTISPECIES: hypothetical protein [Pseudomonadota]MBN6746274.1 hypothetical protein [Acidithiobacillus sp. MC2.2]MDG0857660.1 hypothetical protein [Roseateles puraquae]OWQ96210.1 hypothetical protein CDO81_27360 [Roseateles puraquae]
MTRLRFTFASCLLFAIFGPLVAVLTYVALLAADKQAIYLQGGGTLLLVGYAYLFGALQAVLYGGLTCVGLLGMARFWPSLVAGSSQLRRTLAAQLMGLIVVLLLQGPPLILRGKKVLAGGTDLLASVAKVWEFERSGTALIGLVPFVAWYLFPTIICASLVGWLLVPRLSRQSASGSQAPQTQVHGLNET